MSTSNTPTQGQLRAVDADPEKEDQPKSPEPAVLSMFQKASLPESSAPTTPQGKRARTRKSKRLQARKALLSHRSTKRRAAKTTKAPPVVFSPSFVRFKAGWWEDEGLPVLRDLREAQPDVGIREAAREVLKVIMPDKEWDLESLEPGTRSIFARVLSRVRDAFGNPQVFETPEAEEEVVEEPDPAPELDADTEDSPEEEAKAPPEGAEDGVGDGGEGEPSDAEASAATEPEPVPAKKKSRRGKRKKAETPEDGE